MADAHITPMADIVGERFCRESNKVFYYEGYQLPVNLNDHGEAGDIFAFRGIGGPEVERRIFVKTYATRKSSSTWEEVKHEIRHQKKSSWCLKLNPGFPFWPIWYPVGRASAKTRPLLNLSKTFDSFFHYHANRQPGSSASNPILIGSNDEGEA